MLILHHILDNVAFALDILHFGKLFIFFWNLQIFTKRRRNDFAVSSIVQLSTDVVLDKNIDFSVGVNGESKQPFLEIRVLSVFPIEFILLPHFTETVQANSFPICCVFF
jgi:hypothetical protein